MEDKNEIVDDMPNTPDPYDNLCMRESEVEKESLLTIILNLIKSIFKR